MGTQMADALQKAMGGIEDPCHKIDRIYRSLKVKFDKTLKFVNNGKSQWRFYLLKEELEPVMTEEEMEFVGFWKGTISGKPEHITKDCLKKRYARATYGIFPDLRKEMRKAGKGSYRK